MENIYTCIGTMSGTSLDGLDIVRCDFINKENKWEFHIKKAETYPYSDIWKNKLSNAETLSGLELALLHNEFGRLCGEKINHFLMGVTQKIQFIASHGHTIFHQPEKNLTLQIGSGAEIASKTGIQTICDFRSTDVALGGQGAPLVPIGDKLLFSDFLYCLNLGGFANISFEDHQTRIAFDICPVNIIINDLVKERNIPFDNNGEIARNGKLDNSLYRELNELPYYKITGPKSLGKEWVLKEVMPLIHKYPIPLENKLHTLYEHIALQISNVVKNSQKGNILVTGGGAYNSFLIELLSIKTIHTIKIPNKEVIEFKEALIFAFLGLLRYMNHCNCLKTVTGASKDNIGGAIYSA